MPMQAAGRPVVSAKGLRTRALRLTLLASCFVLLPAPPLTSSLEAMLPVAAVAVSGPAWAWGGNAYGSLGDGTTNSHSSPGPVSMPAGVAFSSVSAGALFSLAIDSQGDAWAWGRNVEGSLGNGGLSDSSVPVAVSMPSGVTFTQISASGFVLALDSSGQAWAWGSNAYGQLGDGTHTASSVPVAVSTPEGVTFTAVSAGYFHALAIDSAGGAWAWGRNDVVGPGLGLLGDGTTVDSNSPVRVALPSGVLAAQISAGPDASVLLDTTGAAWGWGSNLAGQLGDGTNISTTKPVAAVMPSGTLYTSVVTGPKFDIALDANGRAWAWGYNSNGQLGDGGSSNSSLARPVSMPAGVTFAAVAAGSDFGLALDGTGAAWTWGTTGGPVPTAVTMPPGVRFATVAAGMYISLAIQSPPA